MRRFRVLVFALFGLALACVSESPVAPTTCGDPRPIQTYPQYSMERELCFDAIGGGAIHVATSSNPDVATASISGRMLTVTGHEPGAAEIAITARDSDGVAETVVYPVATVHAAIGSFDCSMELSADAKWYEVDWEGWVMPRVDLAGLYLQITVGDQETEVPFGLKMTANRTYQVAGSGLTWADLVSGGGCSVEISSYDYAAD